MRIVITGGASGGHAFPAMTLAEHLKEAIGESDVRVILPEKMLFEFNESEKRSFQVHRVPGRGINILRPWQYPAVASEWLGLFKSTHKILDEINPEIVICFGSFLTVAASLWAKKRGVPAITHEQNVTLGRANQLALNWVTGIALGFSGTYLPRHLNRNLNVRVCGQILRRQFKFFKREPKQNSFNVLIFGGSQGSRQVNEVLFAALTSLQKGIRDKLLCIHITGTADKERAVHFYRTQGIRGEVYDYCSNMAALYARADAVIGRAGAGTITEASAMSVPLILIPFPSHHQKTNAEFLGKRNAAYVIRRNHQAASQLKGAIETFFTNSEERENLTRALKKIVPVDGVANITSWIRECVQKEVVYA